MSSRTTIKTIAVGLALGLILVLAVGSAWAGPTMKLDHRVLDLGQLPQTDSVEGVFQVRNLGDAPLIIQKVAPG